MPQEANLATIPFGKLGIIALESSKSIANKVNDYIVSFRKEAISSGSMPP